MQEKLWVGITLLLLLSASGALSPVEASIQDGNENAAILPVSGRFQFHVRPYGHDFGFRSFRYPRHWGHGLYRRDLHRFRRYHPYDPLWDHRFRSYREYDYSPFSYHAYRFRDPFWWKH